MENNHSYAQTCDEVNVSLNVSLQLTLDIVHAEVVAAEEHNTTEAAKTYKVNCDRRNITGMENFSVQVLNASQVFTLSSEAHGHICLKYTTNFPIIYTDDPIHPSFCFIIQRVRVSIKSEFSWI